MPRNDSTPTVEFSMKNCFLFIATLALTTAAFAASSTPQATPRGDAPPRDTAAQFQKAIDHENAAIAQAQARLGLPAGATPEQVQAKLAESTAGLQQIAGIPNIDPSDAG